MVPQIGFAPVQLIEVVHWTQVLVVVSHAGFAPVHAVAAVVAVHCTHWPSERQAGREALFVWHCRSVAQAAQVFSVRSQMGLAAEAHWPLAVHPTHLPDAESQTAVGAEQRLAPASMPAWQPTHTFPTQKAFVGSVQSLFVPQVPAASTTKASRPGRPPPSRLPLPPSKPTPASETMDASAVPPSIATEPSSGATEASAFIHVARTTSQIRPPVQSVLLSQ